MTEEVLTSSSPSQWVLGDRESSELLIKDLYISLRQRVVAWSAITQQTPQARMGYVGQHLVSIVTGIPGGKSGARGHDLVLPDGEQGEIKTCYRVDQLGRCLSCESTISSIETECSSCGGTSINRSDDSKWLIGIRTPLDFRQVLDPVSYYLVLFEFEDIKDASNDNIIAYIWKVDPKVPGFSYCMIDYKLNIQSNSVSGAPFNLWPWSPKFFMMRPKLIYRSVIDSNSVDTRVFPDDPTVAPPSDQVFPRLQQFSRKTTFTVASLQTAVSAIGETPKSSKADLLSQLEDARGALSNQDLCDLLAEAVYWPLISQHIADLPDQLSSKLPSNRWVV